MKRILVVDDERVIADTLAIILRKFGYEAVACYDGFGALQECESVPPDLVISDVVMPELDGIDMAILIRHRWPACKILLISGVTLGTGPLQRERLEGYDFPLLAKPIRPDELRQEVVDQLKIDAPLPSAATIDPISGPGELPQSKAS
jgi:CheY-like chemotaxis protein